MKRLTLKETQAALLELLTEFDGICRRYGLKYSLAAGTLLGAVRHKGFIPWDDDVDVYMARPDYERFIQLVREEDILPSHLKISKDRGAGTYYCFTKVLDTRYPLKCRNHVEVKYMFLDIFPVDGVPTDKEEREALYKREKKWVLLSGIDQWYTMDRWWGFIAYVIGWWFYLGVNLFAPRKRLVKKMNASALSYPYETCEVAAFHNFGQPTEALPKQSYEELVELEFEGRRFLATKDWDMYLSNKWGDYMKLPPEKQRRSRHYIKLYRKD